MWVRDNAVEVVLASGVAGVSVVELVVVAGVVGPVNSNAVDRMCRVLDCGWALTGVPLAKRMMLAAAAAAAAIEVRRFMVPLLRSW